MGLSLGSSMIPKLGYSWPWSKSDSTILRTSCLKAAPATHSFGPQPELSSPAHYLGPAVNRQPGYCWWDSHSSHHHTPRVNSHTRLACLFWVLAESQNACETNKSCSPCRPAELVHHGLRAQNNNGHWAITGLKYDT